MLYLCFSYLYNNEDVKYFIKHPGVFAGGVAATFGVPAAFTAITGQVEYFINNIFRLSGIASTYRKRLQHGKSPVYLYIWKS